MTYQMMGWVQKKVAKYYDGFYFLYNRHLNLCCLSHTSSHYQEDIDKLCDVVYEMVDGELEKYEKEI